jgi:hypothetical protein
MIDITPCAILILNFSLHKIDLICCKQHLCMSGVEAQCFIVVIAICYSSLVV